ncbi:MULTISPECIES: hypothetical protein [Mycobacteriaceae]|uniref:hypothetical protein n=1 Tax=Mycobacteroides abscessus TaxID=36809 RepID=UPI000C259D7D|nr:hypothetical protein [Mycobacteroides abscessus]
MSTEITVGLIAAISVVVNLVLGHVLANRRTADNLRAAIEREIDIARKLRPGSPEVEALENHITRSIKRLIVNDERRDENYLFLRSGGTCIALLAALEGLLALQRSGRVPERFEFAVAFTTHLTGIASVISLAGFVYIAASQSWYSIRVRRAKAALRKQRRQRDKLWKQFRTQQERIRGLENELDTHKDQIVAHFGQEQWDAAKAQLQQSSSGDDEIERHYREAVERDARLLD